jgi:hypothetical protein
MSSVSYTKNVLIQMNKDKLVEILKGKGLKPDGFMKPILVKSILFSQENPKTPNLPILKEYAYVYNIPRPARKTKKVLIAEISEKSKEKGHSVHLAIEKKSLPPLELSGVYGLFVVKEDVESDVESDAEEIETGEEATFLVDDLDVDVAKRSVYYDGVYLTAMEKIDELVAGKDEETRELAETIKTSMKKMSADQKLLAEMIIRGEVTGRSVSDLTSKAMSVKTIPVSGANDEESIVKRITQRTKTMDADIQQLYNMIV